MLAPRTPTLRKPDTRKPNSLQRLSPLVSSSPDAWENGGERRVPSYDLPQSVGQERGRRGKPHSEGQAARRRAALTSLAPPAFSLNKTTFYSTKNFDDFLKTIPNESSCQVTFPDPPRPRHVHRSRKARPIRGRSAGPHMASAAPTTEASR